jgi:hypothetical protein
MRPSPIIWFERVALLAFTLGILNIATAWDSFTARLSTPPRLAIFLAAQFIYFGIYALLIWSISRWGNPIARWIFVLFVLAAALLFLFLGLPPPPDWPISRTILTVAQCLLTLGSLGLIFGPDTGPWFRGRRVPVDPEIFR